MNALDSVRAADVKPVTVVEGDNPIRIMIVDDHAMIRTALRLLIEKHPRMRVVGEAGTCAEALAIARQSRPDIILLDLVLGDDDGLEVIPEICALNTNSRILVLTGIRNTEIHTRAVLLGAVGVLVKDKPAEMLIKALEKVNNGEPWIDNSTLASVLTEISRRKETKEINNEEGKIATLTPRERQIIAVGCLGLKNRQIAQKLFISESTVRHHLSSIFNKLGTTGRFDLIIYAHRHGLIGEQEPNSLVSRT